jgi:hypothetical protein
MAFRNREGATVDAVPFVVTCGSVFLLLYSFIPPYLLTFGLELGEGLVATTVVYAVVLVAAYYRQVYRVDPTLREEVPARLRFRRLVYLMLISIGVAVLLSLPLVAR